MNILLKGIIEGSKQQILVVVEEEEAAVSIKVLVEGVYMGDKAGLP